jgi:hypothetical protein
LIEIYTKIEHKSVGKEGEEGMEKDISSVFSDFSRCEVCILDEIVVLKWRWLKTSTENIKRRRDFGKRSEGVYFEFVKSDEKSSSCKGLELSGKVEKQQIHHFPRFLHADCDQSLKNNTQRVLYSEVMNFSCKSLRRKNCFPFLLRQLLSFAFSSRSCS